MTRFDKWWLRVWAPLTFLAFVVYVLVQGHP